MKQARFFFNLLHSSIAQLLKQKFNLIGTVDSCEINKHGCRRLQFIIGDQGIAQLHLKGNDNCASDFLQIICSPGTVTVYTVPSKAYPSYYPVSKITYIIIEASEAKKVQSTLGLLSDLAPEPASFTPSM